MRWKKMIATALAGVMLLAGASCKKATVNTSPEFNFETDSQYWTYDMYSFAVAETETGFYYLSESMVGFLHYIDKATMQDIPLCSKPNCVIHETEYSELTEITDTTYEELSQCNAFVRMPGISTGRALMYYKGYLYCVTEETTLQGNAVDRTLTLTQISLDGTERKAIWEIKTPHNSKVSSLSDILLHRGKLYFTTYSGTISDLYCYDLESQKVVELREFRTIPRMMARGDSLLVDVHSGEGMLLYTISTGEWEVLPEEYQRVYPYENGFFFLSVEDPLAFESDFWGTYTDLFGKNPQRVDYPENTTAYAVSEKYLCLYDTIAHYYLRETGEEISREKYLELSDQGEKNIDDLVEKVINYDYKIYDRETMQCLGTLDNNVYPGGAMWFTEDRIYHFNYDRMETGEGEEEKELPDALCYADLADLGSDAFAWKVVEPSR